MVLSWFNGDIGSAIQRAKAKNATFVVVVHGKSDDEVSNAFLRLLDENADSLPDKDFVCVKVEYGTLPANQFSQIYPLFLIPSVYFIDSETGVSMEVTGGPGITKEKLLSSIEKGSVKTGKSNATTANSSSVISANSPTVSSQPAQSGLVNEGASTSSDSKTLLEEKVALAKKIIAEKQKQKKEEEKEKDKDQEKERRDAGKSLQEFKRRQEEQEMTKLAEERRKDKEEEKLARERVRQQIAQDREEKARKRNAVLEETARVKEEKLREETAKKVEAAQLLAAERSKSARLQFRLPDGRSITKVFDAESALSVVYEHVRTDIPKGFKEFTLSTTFPSKKLDDEDPAATLKVLRLSPSATLMVLPKYKSTSMVPSSDGLMAYVWLLLTPLTLLWSFVSSVFPTTTARTNESSRKRNSQDSQAVPNNQSGNAHKRRNKTENFRREGNIARLNNGMDDDDDDNGTYNGNSTQQM